MKKGCMFEAERKGEILELTLRGEIDHHNAVAIRTEMDQRILSEQPKKNGSESWRDRIYGQLGAWIDHGAICLDAALGRRADSSKSQ